MPRKLIPSRAEDVGNAEARGDAQSTRESHRSGHWEGGQRRHVKHERATEAGTGKEGKNDT